jgi:hypothetical protein
MAGRLGVVALRSRHHDRGPADRAPELDVDRPQIRRIRLRLRLDLKLPQQGRPDHINRDGPEQADHHTNNRADHRPILLPKWQGLIIERPRLPRLGNGLIIERRVNACGAVADLIGAGEFERIGLAEGEAESELSESAVDEVRRRPEAR